MAKIFISYRRVDSAPYAGRIYDHLTAHFGADQVFMDIDTIKPGVDFVEVLEEAVQHFDALIAVIGKQWLTVTDSAGNRRLDDPHDFTRLEVEAALNRNIRVFPVLVDGTEMPRTDALPATMAKLTRRNALTVSNERFSYDVNKLISALNDVINPPVIAAAPPIPVAESVRVARRPILAPIVKISEKKSIQVQPFVSIVEQIERKRSIWLILIPIMPILESLFLVMVYSRFVALVYGDSYDSILYLISNNFLIVVISLLGSFVGIVGIWRLNKWGIYWLSLSVLITSLLLWLAFYDGGGFYPADFLRNLFFYRNFGGSQVGFYLSELEFVVFAVLEFLLTIGLFWLILRNKWKYFEGPSIRIFGLKL